MWDQENSTFTVIEIPDPISDLSISVADPDVLLEWGAVEGCDEYTIYRFQEPFGGNRIFVGSTLGTSFTLANETQDNSRQFYTVCLVFGMIHPSDIIITEIMNNPDAVPDSDGEWFEIYNSSDEVICSPSKHFALI